MIRPWKKVSETAPVDHHIFQVRTLEVEHPRTGTTWPRVVLDCPDWVNVVAVTTDEKLILIRQFRFGTWSDTLEIPGGMVDPDEPPARAAARELEEETGYRPLRMISLGASEPNPAMQNNRLHHFLALDCERVHQGAPDEGEDIEVELVPRSELEATVRKGDMRHAMVLAALYWWELHQRPPSGGSRPTGSRRKPRSRASGHRSTNRKSQRARTSKR